MDGGLECVCPLWGWKVCPDVLILHLSAGRALTTGAAHWMTQKLPAFPEHVSPNSSCCVCLCVCVYKKRRRGCINIHTVTDSLKCAAKHQSLGFIAILAAVCFHKNNPPLFLPCWLLWYSRVRGIRELLYHHNFPLRMTYAWMTHRKEEGHM